MRKSPLLHPDICETTHADTSELPVTKTAAQSPKGSRVAEKEGNK